MANDIKLTPLTRDLALRATENFDCMGLILPNEDVAGLVRDVARAQLALYDRTSAVESWIGYLGSQSKREQCDELAYAMV